MALISEEYQNKKLKDYNINIKTKYIVGREVLERNTDGSKNDDIKCGVILSKKYYKNNLLIHEEKDFDTRMEYTFMSKDMEQKENICPNCGATGKLENFIDGCPFCGTYYNIDYTDKELGNKYHYDRVLRNNTYRVITGIVDLVISMLLSLLFIKLTSRTFNIVDVSKVFIYGIILSLILYYFFYTIDAYIVLGPIKRYKDKINQRQINFWNRTRIDKKRFFNNLNYEIKKYYYTKDNIIDYDILDYLSFKEYKDKGNEYIEVTAEVRVISYNNNKIKSKYLKETYKMRKNTKGKLELEEGKNIIKCPNCGGSINANDSKCKFCSTEIKYLQEWILEK